MDGPLRTCGLALLALLVVAAPLTGTAAAASGGLFGVQSVDPDQVLLRVDIQADGDAEWRVEYRVRLDTENETAAFEDLQADLEANESTYLNTFRDRISGTVGAAENATGREMAAEDFSVSARITQLPQEYGVLTYTFTWTNFAVVDGDQLRAGDALAGFFLDAETTLAVGWPDGYQATTVSPDPTERQTDAVLWRGPLDFADGDPRVVAEPDTGGTTTGDGATTTDGSGGGGGDGGLGLGTMLGVLVGVLAIGGAGYLYLRGRGPRGGPDEAPPTIGGADETGAAEPTGGEPAPDDDLLSNEERVVRFLEGQGGRAKQQEIVDALGWTDAKTSQVLSGMASEDAIEKFRIGRENVVKLPEEDGEGDA